MVKITDLRPDTRVKLRKDALPKTYEGALVTVEKDTIELTDLKPYMWVKLREELTEGLSAEKIVTVAKVDLANNTFQAQNGIRYLSIMADSIVRVLPGMKIKLRDLVENAKYGEGCAEKEQMEFSGRIVTVVNVCRAYFESNEGVGFTAEMIEYIATDTDAMQALNALHKGKYALRGIYLYKMVNGKLLTAIKYNEKPHIFYESTIELNDFMCYSYVILDKLPTWAQEQSEE